ncbi:AAA family ATPase [Sphingobium sp. RAC03]|uniref:AAA family ATPase n=1 Tax=Sphingobium sp. RAC03 TaxID=1843368 RepID=UPI0008591777|nr:AAA family ATPase [Sphingobium sp. RAC03]AOF96955.1 archaeal ATPase family protein [Sphingobium sp. RAC03]
MNIMKKRVSPEEVFTPRSHDLNQKTYAERPTLESRLRRALSGHKYIILYGESGNGKTWLYKRVFQASKIQFEVINLAKMYNEGSLNAVLLAKAGDLGASIINSEKKEFDIGLRPGGFGGGYKDTIEYKSMPSAPLELLASQMYIKSGGDMSVLVLDNFEQIVDSQDFIRQIASLIISADDEFVARNKIKIVIVGTPTNIRDMISKVSNATTISNRVVEIPEVARLELAEARHIMSQGFENYLNLTYVIDKNALYKTIAYKTDRIAQHVQELCLKIAQNAVENNRLVTDKVVIEAEREWMEETLSADLAVVESLMNSQRTKVGRKNQVIYCLGMMDLEDFNHHQVEKQLRSTFPVEQELNLNIPQTLAGFCKADTPLIRKTGARGSRYRFCSPKMKMVIRTRLKLASDNSVIRAS